MPSDFALRVLSATQKHGLLAPGARVGVGVSGGADSVALLFALYSLASANQWKLTVLHGNHHLRGGESDDDAAFVEALASRLGLVCQIADLAIQGVSNVEEKARQARYSFFTDAAREHQIESCALGHTLDDQAETVLLKFLRGAGSAGLAGIFPKNGLFVRPLIEIRKNEATAYLKSLGEPWREDSSNGSLNYDRNRVRHELLPQLVRDWNPELPRTLAATAEWARAEEMYWNEATRALATQLGTSNRGARIFQNEAILALPLAVQRRLVRQVIHEIKGDLRTVGFSHIEDILALFCKNDGSGRLQVPGVDVIRSFDRVRFAKNGEYAVERSFEASIAIPGQVFLPDEDSAVLLQVQDSKSGYTEGMYGLDAGQLTGRLALRYWQPGDQFRQPDSAAPVKIKQLFQEARVPIWERRTWPVLALSREASGSTIVWTRQFGVAEGFQPNQDTAQVVWIQEVPTSTGNGNQNADFIRPIR